MKTALICMSFDGEFQRERPTFDSIEAAWTYSNDLGSKWYFYPFHFVTTESHKTIRAASPDLEWLVGRRVESVARLFLRVSKIPEAKHAGIDDFVLLLNHNAFGYPVEADA